MLIDLSLLFRGAGLAVALLLAVMCLRAPGRARVALVPLLICLCAYLVRSAPQVAATQSLVLLLPLSVGALLFPVAFWWLVHNAFADRSDIPPAVWVAGLVLVVTGLAPADLSVAGVPLQSVQKLTGAGFVLVALWRMWRTAPGDVVAARRRVRPWLLGYAGLHGLTVLAVELWLQGRAAAPALDTLNTGVIAAGLAVIGVFFLRVDGDAAETLFGKALPESSSPVGGGVVATARVAAPESGAPDLREAPGEEWTRRVCALMEEQRLHRNPDFTLAMLAQRAGLPEYRLRDVIHKALGYRNFPAFVNAHRLGEVEQRLRDPACDRLPILTIALEAGFGSIGPFNRAFRERHGMTPTEYRNARAGAPSHAGASVAASANEGAQGRV